MRVFDRPRKNIVHFVLCLLKYIDNITLVGKFKRDGVRRHFGIFYIIRNRQISLMVTVNMKMFQMLNRRYLQRDLTIDATIRQIINHMPKGWDVWVFVG